MSSNPITEFKSRVEAYLVRTRMSERRFGKFSCNDSSFVADLRGGREPRFSTIEKVDAFMTDHPDGSIECASVASKVDCRAS
jgi:hypothetical protein